MTLKERHLKRFAKVALLWQAYGGNGRARITVTEKWTAWVHDVFLIDGIYREPTQDEWDGFLKHCAEYLNT